ncbi:putative quinol monooxygenase [Chitinophaga sancti]|nr:putative quinol monooxygenase [Chitinophaga sancti]WQD65513.1 putative quinol monooxygenase [Chitinophaga sancti]WQG88864.1 putative quinol monooxygenase [Chitinophaga sancti]
MKTLKIVARVTVSPENRKDVLASILKCAALSRAEEGNVYYNVTEHVSNPAIIVILEEWKSQAAIDFHNSTAHFKELVQAITGKADIAIDVLSQIN